MAKPKPMYETKTNLELIHELRAARGWVTKFQKKAEFWEAEARRMGSRSEYRIYGRGKYGDDLIIISPPTPAPISQDVPRETPPAIEQLDLSEWTEPMPRDDWEALKRFGAVYLQNLPSKEQTGVAAPDPEPSVPAEPTKRWVDVTQFKLPSGYRIASHIVKFNDVRGRKCINVLTGAIGVINKAVRSSPGSEFPHKAYKVYYDETGERIFEMARDIWILEQAPVLHPQD